jgi:deoxyribonuclease-4
MVLHGVIVKFGVHVSIAGGIHLGLLRAVELGCDTAQFFLVNPRSWKSNPLTDMEIERFLQVRNQEAKQICPLVAHMPYLPNLASLDEEIFNRSIGVLQDHLMRCEALKVDYLVLHMGKGEVVHGIERMREGIDRAYADRFYSVVLLLEIQPGREKKSVLKYLNYLFFTIKYLTVFRKESVSIPVMRMLPGMISGRKPH